MTPAQFKNYGLELDTWINLDETCQALLVSNEGHIFSTPKTMEIYLDSSCELVWVRYMTGKLSTDPKYADYPDYVPTEHKGITYYTELVSGGLTDKTVGRYHSVYDMNQITMIH